MATAQNIEIDQDSDYSKTFTAKDDTGTVIDLTTAPSTLAAQIRKSYATTTATDFTATVTPAVTTGEFTLALTDVQTAAMERGRHVYDVVHTVTSTEIKTRIMEGIAVVSPSVTR
jgi:hypothetical protein